MTREIIKAVVDAFDPAGLLAISCPSDEYDPEIDRIFERVRDGMSTDEVAKVIYDVFLQMFDESYCRIDTFRDMAREMFARER